MAFVPVQVRFSFVAPHQTVAGTQLPASGSVEFRPSAPLIETLADQLAARLKRSVTLDEAGEGSIYLYANDTATVEPPGTTWHVTERIDGQPTVEYDVEITEAMAALGVELADLPHAVPGPNLFSYALDSTVLHRTGNETAAGNKVFSGQVAFGGGSALQHPWVDPYAFGGDGTGTGGAGGTADNSALNSTIASSGSTAAQLRFLRMNLARGGWKATATLVFDRRTGELRGGGSGAGSGNYGSNIISAAVVGTPAVQIKRSVDFLTEAVRVTAPFGNTPSAGFNVHMVAGDNPTTSNLTFRRLWIGRYPFEADQTRQFVVGFLVDGDNGVNGDNCSVKGLKIPGTIEAAIKVALTQAVNWSFDDVHADSGAYGARIAPRQFTGRNWQLNSFETACFDFLDEAWIDIEGFGSEHCLKLLVGSGVKGGRLGIRNGYFRVNAEAGAGGNVNLVDVDGGGPNNQATLELDEFRFDASGDTGAPAQPKLKFRNACVRVVLKGVNGIGAPDDFLDLTTTQAGEIREVTLENYWGTAGRRYTSGPWYWVHGDPPPSLNWDGRSIGTSGCIDIAYPGSPVGVIAAKKGSRCVDTTGGKLYVKESANDATGWVQK